MNYVIYIDGTNKLVCDGMQPDVPFVGQSTKYGVVERVEVQGDGEYVATVR